MEDKYIGKLTKRYNKNSQRVIELLDENMFLLIFLVEKHEKAMSNSESDTIFNKHDNLLKGILDKKTFNRSILKNYKNIHRYLNDESE